MCNKEECNCVFWRNFNRLLHKHKDFKGEININEVRAILFRLFHLEKPDWNTAINGAKDRGMLKYVGKENGCVYKVNGKIG